MPDPQIDPCESNRFGYRELKEKPTPEELDRYYSAKYYQDSKGHYAKAYEPEELRYFRTKLEQKRVVIDRLLPAGRSPGTLLDIGAGEGWALAYFRELGWKTTGIDYSQAGCAQHNPHCLPDLKVGDIPTLIQGMLAAGEKFDVLWLDNVLEHLLDPLRSLREFRGLLRDGGLLILEVPNDFSALQEEAFAKGLISRRFWIAIPDHISYFNRDGLTALCAEAGWDKRFLMGDFPIDFNLFNPATNYIENKAAGRPSHMARVALENMLGGISVEKTVELYRQLAELGLGRQIVGFFSKSDQAPA